ncbi:HD domain-containing protein [Chryseobacterium sp. D764]|uniref:HD domain-containing protein n=1 Tax=Chryseobacterium sp. D764 TaxID=2856522 RepID=UPI001C579648|nr:HD domain-containing protein [Chryseobacterium sp. D764]QXU50172.1 HD domain-containing protein [Chryseobacterium sp. D764]
MNLIKTGKILDPIHGLIQITEIEEYIINQRIFGRLRKVKQNTLLNYVFPGANHSRFEHSLGVMHLAEVIFHNSNENVKIARVKNERDPENNDYIEAKSVYDFERNNKILLVRLQELRLAALLHDVGHGPTSHKFDDFTTTGEGLMKILKSNPDFFGKYIDLFKVYIEKKGLDKNINHELVSCVFIISLIKTLKLYKSLTKESILIVEEISIDNILKMIEPDFLPDYEIMIGDGNFSDYFNSIIASFPFDADRMDYLYRDSFYSGVKYGFFDQSRILTSLLPINAKDRYTLGIKMSGLDSVIRFIQSRNHLYNQVYFHKTNSATNSMLDFIFGDLNINVLEDIQEFVDYENFYCENSDEYFFNVTLRNILQENHCTNCENVLNDLLNRKLWKRCYEKRENVADFLKFDTKKFDESKLKVIKSELNSEGIFIQENYCSNIGLKGFYNSKGEIKTKSVVIDKKGKLITQNWDSITDEMKFLNQTNTFIKRIYVNRKGKMENELSEIEEVVRGKFIEHGLIDIEN